MATKKKIKLTPTRAKLPKSQYIVREKCNDSSIQPPKFRKK
jgi:hypothetical protein